MVNVIPRFFRSFGAAGLMLIVFLGCEFNGKMAQFAI
jgi:hypothetical protein